MARTKRRSCEGKKGYTEKEAGLQLRRRKAMGALRLYRYKCPYCTKWHLGHRKAGREKRSIPRT